MLSDSQSSPLRIPQATRETPAWGHSDCEKLLQTRKLQPHICEDNNPLDSMVMHTRAHRAAEATAVRFDVWAVRGILTHAQHCATS